MDKTENSKTDHILTKSMCVRFNAKLNVLTWVSSRFSIWSRKVWNINSDIKETEMEILHVLEIKNISIETPHVYSIGIGQSNENHFSFQQS